MHVVISITHYFRMDFLINKTLSGYSFHVFLYIYINNVNSEDSKRTDCKDDSLKFRHYYKLSRGINSAFIIFKIQASSNIKFGYIVIHLQLDNWSSKKTIIIVRAPKFY